MYTLSFALELSATLCAFFALVFWLLTVKSRNLQQVIFGSLLCIIAIEAVSQGLATMFEYLSMGTGKYINIVYAMDMLFFIVNPALPALLVLYILELNGTLLYKTKKFYFLFSLPLIITEVYVLLNPIYETIFKFENYHYVRQPGIIFAYIEALGYILLGVYYSIKMRGSFEWKKFRAIIIFFGIVLVGLTIQTITHIQIQYLIQSLAAMGFIILVEDEGGKYDSITGLFNKNSFFDENRRMIHTNRPYSIINIQLKRFIKSNPLDTDSQNLLMRQVSDFLGLIYKKSRIFFHDGTDFAIILYNEDEFVRDQILDAISNRFERLWYIGDGYVTVSPLISVITIPDCVDNLEDLRTVIETEYGGPNDDIVYLNRDSLELIRREKEVERLINRALQNNLFKVFYQPIYDCRVRKITAAEALIRLQDDSGNFVSPEYFIPISERNGTISAVGRVVFEEVCRFIKSHNLEDLGIKYIEVNLSVNQLMANNLAQQFKEIMEQYGVRSDQINLEITETYFGAENKKLSKNKENMENNGFTFSLDDFGTGYSNLVRMFEMNFTNIKFDKSLLWNTDGSKKNTTGFSEIAKAVLNMDFNIIQEGVETEEQLRFVSSLGIQMVQGFYFSKPIPGEEFYDYVKNFNYKEYAGA